MVVDLVFGEGELVTVGVALSLILLSAFWTLLSLLGCVTQPWYEGFVLVLIVSCCAVFSQCPWGACCFLGGDEGVRVYLRKRRDWSSKKLRKGNE